MGNYQRLPFWLPSTRDAIACCLHLSANGYGSSGVVICPPLGFEYTHSHRSLRHLADALASAGHLALRFDYYATGSSPGDAAEAGLVDTWAGDIASTAAFLEELTGQLPSVIGVRAGALLACLASSRRPFAKFVGWAPVVSGRLYARQWDALARIASSDDEATTDLVEAGGFGLTPDAIARLRALDATALDLGIRDSALLLHHPAQPIEGGFVAALENRGLVVHQGKATGYDKMMAEPQYTIVPHESIEHIVTWLAPTASSQPRRRLEAPLQVTSALARETEVGVERFVRVPGAPSLFGVLTEPRDPQARQRPALVLLNSGSVHQVGPNRVYVELARALGAGGFASLRLDLRNLGDSVMGTPTDENHPYPATATDDSIRAAEWLSSDEGGRPVVLAGICSGAHTAFHAGLVREPRNLRGVILINPLTFYWSEGLSLDIPSDYQTIKDAGYYGRALRDPGRWLALLRGQSQVGYISKFVLRHAAEVVGRSMRDGLEALRLRRASQLTRDLRAYRDLERRIDFVFSRSDPGHAILLSEARREVRTLEREDSVWFIEDANHTFTRRDRRVELARIVVDRLRRYPPIALKDNYPVGSRRPID